MKKSDFDYRSIKSFEDACAKEGVDPTLLPDCSMILEEFREALINAYKLFVIFKAINNGWVADFTNPNQVKYFPWMKVNSSGSGFGFAHSVYDFDRSSSHVGSRLCTYDPEVAVYIGEQFAPEYAKFHL